MIQEEPIHWRDCSPGPTSRCRCPSVYVIPRSPGCVPGSVCTYSTYLFWRWHVSCRDPLGPHLPKRIRATVLQPVPDTRLPPRQSGPNSPCGPCLCFPLDPEATALSTSNLVTKILFPWHLNSWRSMSHLPAQAGAGRQTRRRPRDILNDPDFRPVSLSMGFATLSWCAQGV